MDNINEEVIILGKTADEKIIFGSDGKLNILTNTIETGEYYSTMFNDDILTFELDVKQLASIHIFKFGAKDYIIDFYDEEGKKLIFNDSMIIDDGGETGYKDYIISFSFRNDKENTGVLDKINAYCKKNNVIFGFYDVNCTDTYLGDGYSFFEIINGKALFYYDGKSVQIESDNIAFVLEDSFLSHRISVADKNDMYKYIEYAKANGESDIMSVKINGKFKKAVYTTFIKTLKDCGYNVFLFKKYSFIEL